MTEPFLKSLLEAVKASRCSIDDALSKLRKLPFEDLGFAKVDHHRGLRCGFPEVIYCEGKSTEQITSIFDRCVSAGANVLATRVSTQVAKDVVSRFDGAVYHETARVISFRQQDPPKSFFGSVAIVSAGTSDIPVAEEARVTAEIMDQRVETFYDVGVAGIHRLLAHTEAIQQATVAIVVAGMEGALPSVVGGLVECPVIAVPTSIGYGASFEGLAALLAMLNSCASGVTVVNIDNGFGAGYTAAMINRQIARVSQRTSPCTMNQS